MKLGARINATGRPEDMAAFVAQRLLDVLGATCCEVHKIDHGQLRCLLSIDRRLSRDETTAADRTGVRRLGRRRPRRCAATTSSCSAARTTPA